MISILFGVGLLLCWGVLQFVVQPATGYIHLILAAGVIVIIRGIVLASGRSSAPSP